MFCRLRLRKHGGRLKTTKTNDRQDQGTEVARARDSLNRYLALRDHSRFELREKLSRHFAADVVDRVPAEAEESHLLATEEQVAEMTVAALERKFKSSRYIEGMLRKRQLPVPADLGKQELEKACALVERKFGDPKELSPEEREKAFRFLTYRGFEDRWIRQVLNEER